MKGKVAISGFVLMLLSYGLTMHGEHPAIAGLKQKAMEAITNSGILPK